MLYEYSYAVNSYFREVFTVKSNGLFDFEPPRTLFPPTLIGSHHQTSDHSPISVKASTQQGHDILDLGKMDGFPCSILEEIFKHLDAWSLCQASLVNKAFSKVCEGRS